MPESLLKRCPYCKDIFVESGLKIHIGKKHKEEKARDIEEKILKKLQRKLTR